MEASLSWLNQSEVSKRFTKKTKIWFDEFFENTSPLGLSADWHECSFFPYRLVSFLVFSKCFFLFFQKSHLFLAAFCSLCLTTFTQGQFQFSDLIGSETVRAEQVKLTATKNNANDNAVKLKTKDEEKVTIGKKYALKNMTSSL